MSLFVTPITRVHNLDGTLRLNLSPATGFRRLGGTAPGGIPQWRTNTVTGLGVDSETESTAPTRAALQMAYRFKVKGDAGTTGEPYWDSVDGRIIALTEALSTRFLWAISTGGRLWTYRSVSVANVDASAWEREHEAAGYRLVLVTFKAHPNATTTPLSEV